MNSLLLWLGIVVALLLTAAFAVPFFVDWSGQRAFFEARASQIVGRPVAFDGPLDVRMVPFPALVARDVRIGEGEPRDHIEELRLRAALAPLLSGQVRLSEMVVTRPSVAVGIDAEGRVSWGEGAGARALPLSPDATIIDSFRIVEGAVTIDDRRLDGTIRVDELNAEGVATTLAGPFRMEGGMLVDGERYTFRLATGRIETGRFRMTASVQPAARPLTVGLDGTVLTGGDTPGYQGGVTIERPDIDDETRPPWRLTGSVRADPSEIVFSQLGLQFGPEASRIELSGAANVTIGEAPAFDAVLSARQIDLDRTFGGGPDDPVSPAEAIAQIGRILDPQAFPVPGRVGIDVGSMVVASNLVENLAADIEIADGRWRIERAELSAPGNTQVGLAGTIGFSGETPTFDGAVRLIARNAGALSGWLAGTQMRLPGIGAVSGRIDASAAVHLNAEGFGLERLDIDTDRTRLRGSLAYRQPREGARGQLDAAIETDRFEVGDAGGDAGAALARLAEQLGGTDLHLEINAQEMVLGPRTASGVRLAMELSEGAARIERLSVAGLGGIAIEGEGSIRDLAGMPEGRATLRLEADDLSEAAAMLRDLGLDAAAEAMTARAGALAPLRLHLELEASRAEAVADGSEATLRVEGTAGGSVIEASLDATGRTDDPSNADFVFSGEARNPDGARLGEQLGLDPAVSPDGRGRISLAANGRPAQGVPFLLVSEGLGIDGRVDGHARMAGSAGWEVSGDANVTVARPRAVAAMGGVTFADGAPQAPLSVEASLSATGEVWRASDIVASTGESAVRGAVAVDFGRTTRAVSGRFEADALDLPWLMAALLGAEAFDAAGAIDYGDQAWPETPFDPVEREGWRGEIALESPHATLGAGMAASDASLVLRFDEDRITLSDIEARLHGGRLAGELDFVTVDGGVALEARLDLTDARLEDFVWRSDGRAVARGVLSAGIEAQGTGRSIAGVVSTLSGSGSFDMADATVRRMNGAAFARVVAAADAGLELTEERVREVFAGHLDAGSLQVAEAGGAISLSGGVMRIANARVDAGPLDAFASATLDLTVMGIDSEWTLRVDAGDEDGRTREIGVVFAGPLDAPERELDVTPLVGYLTVRAFEQEVDRLERLQADIAEREFFDRALRRLNERRRARERAAEEARRREEEAAAAADAAAEEQETGGAGETPSDGERLRRLIEDALRDGIAPNGSGIEMRPLPPPGGAGEGPPGRGGPIDIRPGLRG